MKRILIVIMLICLIGCGGGGGGGGDEAQTPNIDDNSDTPTVEDAEIPIENIGIWSSLTESTITGYLIVYGKVVEINEDGTLDYYAIFYKSTGGGNCVCKRYETVDGINYTSPDGSKISVKRIGDNMEMIVDGDKKVLEYSGSLRYVECECAE